MKVNAVTMLMKQLGSSGKNIVAMFRQLVWCRHSSTSRPFTINDEPYRICLGCGARWRFDKYSWTKLAPTASDLNCVWPKV
jgi:hypothetical protein